MIRGLCPTCGELREGTAPEWFVGVDGAARIVVRCEVDGTVLLTSGELVFRRPL